MGISINTNMASMRAQRRAHELGAQVDSNSKKLSSGKRINSAADDSSRLAIDDKVMAKLRSSKVADRNTNDGIQLLNVADGSVRGLHSLLSRIRELAVQSSSDILSDHDRTLNNREVQELKYEMGRQVETAEFAGRKLFVGEGARFEIQVGTGGEAPVDRVVFDSSMGEVNTITQEVKGVQVSTKDDSRKTLETILPMAEKLSRVMTHMGSLQNRLQSVTQSLGGSIQAMDITHSALRDTDYMEEKSEQVKLNLGTQATTAILAQASGITKIAANLVG